MTKKFLLAIIVAVATISTSALAEPVNCGNEGIRLSGLQNLPVEFSKPIFFSAERWSDGKLQAVNRGSVPIRSYLVLVEYIDKNHKHVLSIPFFNQGMKEQLPSAFARSEWLGSYGEESNDGLSQGEEITLVASAPFITSSCPDRASIEYVYLTFSDGNAIEFGSKPLLETLLVNATLGGRMKNLPAMVRGKISLTADGLVDDVELSSPLDAGLSTSIVGGLRAGSFFHEPSSVHELPFVLLNATKSKAHIANDKWFREKMAVLILLAEPSHDGWRVYPSTAKTGVASPRLRVADTR
jgi:hypothetical protein